MDSVAPLPPPATPATASPAAVDRRGAWKVGRRGLLVGIGVAVVVLLVAFAGWRLVGGGQSSEDRYLQALEDAGLRDDFAADRAALAAARSTCEDLDGGADPQGSEAQLIAVEQFCPDYEDGFHILEVQEIDGSFTISDADSAGFQVGGPCQGEGGYGDLNSSTQVVVSNPDGDELTRAQLGPGETTSIVTCQFEFTVELTEGEETYIFEVGDRGELSYSWDEVTTPGIVAFTIG